MHLALYRSERPEYFEDLIGQKHIVKILQNQLKTGTVSQAYLFTGTRGTGKTTTARILAKALNCTGAEDGSAAGTPEEGRVPCGHCENCRAISEGRFLDVIEMDAASNNRVDDFRRLIDSVQYPPTVGRYKVYIIDEVHMLSTSAENAFLKTLEEPPEYVVFILATTNPEKVRETIRSRCMTLNFKRVSETDLIEGMRRICDKKGIEIDEDALGLIAVDADGSVRDALSLLEQCISTGDSRVTRDIVLEYTGSAGDDFYLSLTDSVSRGDISTALTDIDSMIKSGRDAKILISDWLGHCRNLLIAKFVEDPKKILGRSEENTARLKEQADGLERDVLERMIGMLSKYVELARYSTQPRILLETAAVKMAFGDTAQPEPAPVSPSTRAARRPDGGARAAAFRKPPVKKAVPQAEAPEPQAVKQEEAPAAAEESQEVKPLFEEKPAMDGAEDRHIGEVEGPGDLDTMWARIIGEATRKDAYLKIIFGENSRAEDFRNDELTVTVKPNKLRLAEDSRDEIERTARKLYGANIFITFKAGDVTPVNIEEPDPEQEMAEAEEEVDSDEFVDELAEDASRLLGVEVTVND
jgi:DNA polymerase-3 subunit gamma/tau